MSDKAWEKLTEADRQIRTLRVKGHGDMYDGPLLTITFFQGFEAFNTRPYHNYETWGDGYTVRTHDGIEAMAEDLDDALALLRKKIEQAKKQPAAQPPSEKSP